jgi:glycosyltransferase involved in cell wall biosynthesis
VLTVGGLLAAELRRRGARRTWVVGNWKPLEEFAPAGDAAAARRREMGLDGGLLVAYIGWLNADRGVAPLLEAVAGLEGVSLLVGGDGPLAAGVRRAAEACPRIRYLGFVDPGQIPLYTSLSDVIYYGLDASNPNSRYSAPNKLFEALAAGKAVVCNACGEIGRIVRDEGCGRVVAALTREALAAALDELRQPDRLADCQRRAREAGRNRYNWAKAEQELVALYAAIGLLPERGMAIRT